jgi:hypothetical protein
MPSEQATILIPDISGYTEFVSKAEIEHGAQILTYLLETIVHAAGDDFVVSEIEGDAVLMYRKGSPPSKQEITEKCIRIFKAFHETSTTMDGMRVCQCIACKGVVRLSLKFIVHYGTISENKVANFNKASGIDMVIAHRLLKNRIEKDEYVLMTRNFLNQTTDADASFELEWFPLKENYASIGDIEFYFAPLDQYREDIMAARKSCEDKLGEKVYDKHTDIRAYYHDVFGQLIDIPLRMQFIPGIRDIEFIIPVAAIGMAHTWQFNTQSIEAIPMGIDVTNSSILYWEEIRLVETGGNVIVEYLLGDISKEKSDLGIHLYKVPGKHLSTQSLKQLAILFDGMMIRMKEMIGKE